MLGQWASPVLVTSHANVREGSLAFNGTCNLLYVYSLHVSRAFLVSCDAC